MNVVELIFGAFLNGIMQLYIVSKLLDKKMTLKKTIVAVLILTVYIGLGYWLTSNAIRIIINFLMMVAVNKICFKDTIMKTICATFMYFVILFFSETLYVLFSILVLNIDIEQCKILFLNGIVTNILIYLICLFIVNIPFILKFSKKIMQNISYKYDSILIICIILMIVTFSALTFMIFFNISAVLMLFFNVLIIIIYAIIGYFLLKEKNDNIKMNMKYESAIYNLKEYEKMLDRQRKINHNNKNDLISIKGMLSKKDDNNDIIEYVDEILNEKRKDDQAILDQTIGIPYGGLQGLIYQKLLVMKDNKIKYKLDISNSVKSLQKLKLNSKQIKDVCTIIGIYLDNSIEEVEKIDNKEIMISLSYSKNILVITVSNTYNDVICLDRLEVSGYSTKGIGRGHGLKIAKDIIDKNTIFSNEKRINGNIFSQILKIKM